jgi:PEP-CTERM motif
MTWYRSSFMCGCVAFFAPLIVIVSSAKANITLTVTPSLAPNGFGSPSWPTYVTNAQNALQNGLSSSGTPNAPTFYQALANGSTIGANEIVATDFNSWLGSANPGTVYGSQYANELGNRLHFGLTAIGSNGTTFSLSELSFNMTSSDPGNSLGFAGSFNSSDSYSSAAVGVIFNGSKKTFVTSGPATQLVDALYYVGVGNAYEALSTDPGATNQDKLNNAIASIPSETVTTTYTIHGFSGSASANVSAVPEPSTLLLTSIVAAVALGLAWRRRKHGVVA